MFDVFSGQGPALGTCSLLPRDIQFHCSLKLHDFVYSIGGKAGFFEKVLDSVWQTNIKQQHCEWREIAPMKESRYHMGATVHQNRLVVAGGQNKEVLNSSEYYDPTTILEWSTISPLKRHRSGNALISYDDSLFAIGGQNGREVLYSVERLQDWDGDWEEVAPMLTPRHSFAAVSYQGSIIVIGGQCSDDASSALQSVEIYDCYFGAWSCVGEMGIAWSRHSACVLDGKIFVVGGQDENPNIVREHSKGNSMLQRLIERFVDWGKISG